MKPTPSASDSYSWLRRISPRGLNTRPANPTQRQLKSIARSAREGALSSCRLPPKGGTAMCGIVGYVGQRSAQDVLLAGLEKLEYRGYDSAGISVQSDGDLESVRAVGNLSALKAAITPG